MEKKLLEEYAVICNQEKVIAAQKEVMKKQIEEAFGQNPVKEDTDMGTFVMVPRSTYTYSKKVKDLEVRLKGLMKDEVEMGIAEEKKTYSLRFNAKKED
jgi:hypothetical protein